MNKLTVSISLLSSLLASPSIPPLFDLIQVFIEDHPLKLVIRIYPINSLLRSLVSNASVRNV